MAVVFQGIEGEKKGRMVEARSPFFLLLLSLRLSADSRESGLWPKGEP